MRKCAAEFFGTFCLVFAGTGAIVVNESGGGVISHLGVAAAFGLVVMVMIYTVGDVSGAHLNPAVSIAFFSAGRFAGALVLPYIASQILGALAASGILRALFPANTNLGLTAPAGSVLQAFVFEVILTLILMWVILSVSTGAKEKGITAGVAVGAVIGLEALFGGPISGASMNPARSLGPAIIALKTEALWIYLVAPVVGALLAILVCRGVRADCCSAPFWRSPADDDPNQTDP